jgi:hypothetical protein
MKNKNLKFVFLSGVLLITGILGSCKKETSSDVTNISSYDESRSHNEGKNCMQCHVSGGEGYGWFTVAGTVYKSDLVNTYSNATVKLYTENNGGGILKYTIKGDNLGNFFTTEQVDFGSGLYPVVEGTSGTQYMPFSVKTGECNSCHGSSTDLIWTK